MSKIKRVDTENGRTLYFVDGKMKSKNDLPAGIVSSLEPGVEIEIDFTPQPRTIDTKVCVVCGEQSTHMKFLNEMNIGLCDEHYQLSTGKVAQALREN